MKRIYYILLLMMIAVSMSGADKKFVLVIDPGHGGKDAGAVGAFSKEKNINLKTALAFGRYVEKNCPDVKVIYTRKTDVFIELYERAEIANKNHADVFISIHTNALPAGHISRGVETYSMTLRRSEEKLSAAQRENAVITYEKDYEQRYAGYDSNSEESRIMYEYINDENMARSVELAKYVQKSICSTANRPDKGVKQDNFHVLRRTSMPACLVELGFISTPDEEQMLNNDNNIEQMALGIFKGFIKYKNSKSSYTENLPVLPEPQQDPLVKIMPPEQMIEPVAEAPKVVKSSKETKPEKTAEKTDAKESAEETDDAPVFKVQFLTGPKAIREGSSMLKGLTGTSFYKDGNVYKFTVGEFKTFGEANSKKKEIADKFPDAFVIAMRNGMRIDLNEARNYKK